MCISCEIEAPVVVTEDGMFPEKAQYYIVQYKRNGQWFTPAKHYDVVSATHLYNRWSSCTVFDEVVLKDSRVGLMRVCYPSESRFLTEAGEKHATV
jgi:hypothetical protein